MKPTHHAIMGEITGNPTQPQGRHREFGPGKKIGLIPLGSRTRVVGEAIHLIAMDDGGAERVDKWNGI